MSDCPRFSYSQSKTAAEEEPLPDSAHGHDEHEIHAHCHERRVAQEDLVVFRTQRQHAESQDEEDCTTRKEWAAPVSVKQGPSEETRGEAYCRLRTSYPSDLGGSVLLQEVVFVVRLECADGRREAECTYCRTHTAKKY